MKYLILFFVGLIGLCVGSFLNVVIYRLPLKMSLAKPDSHCPKCKTPIKWYDNIPVLSYILLGGKCRACKVHIPIRYTLVEILTAVLWIVSAVLFYEQPYYVAILCIVMSCLVSIFFIDLENMIIPDSLNIIIFACAIASVFAYSNLTWLDHLIGLAVGGGFFLLFFYLGGAIFHKDALGGGDVKFMAAAGALLGWKCTLLTILIGSVTASVVMLIATKKDQAKSAQKKQLAMLDVQLNEDSAQINSDNQNQQISEDDEQASGQYPFGPFLAAATAISLIFGEQIINSYLSLLSGGF